MKYYTVDDIPPRPHSSPRSACRLVMQSLSLRLLVAGRYERREGLGPYHWRHTLVGADFIYIGQEIVFHLNPFVRSPSSAQRTKNVHPWFCKCNREPASYGKSSDVGPRRTFQTTANTGTYGETVESFGSNCSYIER